MRPGGISAEGGSAADFAAVKAIASVMSTRSATSEGGGRSSGSRGGGRSKKGLRDVVFTPLYGCDENGHGVGPVCSLLEVRHLVLDGMQSILRKTLTVCCFASDSKHGC